MGPAVTSGFTRTDLPGDFPTVAATHARPRIRQQVADCPLRATSTRAFDRPDANVDRHTSPRWDPRPWLSSRVQPTGVLVV
jgi:hypothetical protein